MKTALNQQLQTLNDSLDALFADLAQHSSAVLNRPPAPDSWSPMQVLHHLLLSEKYSRLYCEKKLSHQPELPQAGVGTWFRTKLVRWYLLSPLKFKAPPGISGAALPASDELPNVIAQYHAERENFQAFLNGLPDEYLDKEVYKHPFGGRLTMGGMMTFFTAHFENHRRQIYRALR
jgi:hypothetical protein